MHKDDRLTNRERDVLDLAVVHYDDHEIADQLGVKISVVRTHWKNIKHKSGKWTRTAAIRWYRDWYNSCDPRA